MNHANYYGDISLPGRDAPALFISGKLEERFRRWRAGVRKVLPAPVPHVHRRPFGEARGREALSRWPWRRSRRAASDAGDRRRPRRPGRKGHLLRFVLAEDRIRYTGGNGLRYHHMVVRAIPGGARSVAADQEDARANRERRPGRGGRRSPSTSTTTLKDGAPFPRRPPVGAPQLEARSRSCRTTRQKR